MENVYRELGPKGLVVLAVNYREDAETVRRFVTKYGLTYPVLLDDGSVAKRYDLYAVPVATLSIGMTRAAARGRRRIPCSSGLSSP